MKKKKEYSIRVRVWLENKDEIFIGIGRAILLENIGKTGSITNAAKEMKMSYRQAWQFVEDINRNANEPLVEKILGGKNGGGAQLTEAGKKAISNYYKLQNKINDFVTKEAKKLKF